MCGESSLFVELIGAARMWRLELLAIELLNGIDGFFVYRRVINRKIIKTEVPTNLSSARYLLGWE
jgi:hypothetical protein